MRVEGVEHGQAQRPDGPLRFQVLSDHIQRVLDHMVGRRGEQVALVRHVPIDGSSPRREAGRQDAEGQGALAAPIQDLDRSLDDARLRQRLGSPFPSPRLAGHG